MTTHPNSEEIHRDHYENNVGRPTLPDRGGLNEAHAEAPSSGAGEASDAQPEEARAADRPAGGEQTSGDRYGRDEGARNPNLDPQPENTPGLERGSGVSPGETPPESNSASASPPSPPPSAPPKTKTVTALAVTLIALLVLLFFVAYMVGLIG